MSKRIDAIQERIKKLSEYTQHEKDCDVRSGKNCSCGLNDTIKELELLTMN